VRVVKSCLGNGGVGGWGVEEGWNGIGGVLILGCELGDSLLIIGRMAQSFGRSISEMGFFLERTTET